MTARGQQSKYSWSENRCMHVIMRMTHIEWTPRCQHEKIADDEVDNCTTATEIKLDYRHHCKCMYVAFYTQIIAK